MRKGIVAGGVAATMVTAGTLGLVLGAGAQGHRSSTHAALAAAVQASSPSAQAGAATAGAPGPMVTAGLSGSPAAAGFSGLATMSGAFGDLSVLTKVLGISQDALKSAIAGGQSLAQIATASNVDPQKVVNALVAAATSRINEAVAAGLLPKSVATQVISMLPTLISAVIHHALPSLPKVPGLSGLPGLGALAGSVGGLGTSTLTNALGISEAALKAALAGGQSLAQIATAHGIDPQAVIGAVTAAATAQVNAAVSAGLLLQPVATQILSTLTQLINSVANHAFPALPPVPGLPTLSGLPGLGGLGGPMGGVSVPTLTNALGISQSALRSSLASGQSLAQIATANGIDPQRIINAILDALQGQLPAGIPGGLPTGLTPVGALGGASQLSGLAPMITSFVSGMASAQVGASASVGPFTAGSGHHH